MRYPGKITVVLCITLLSVALLATAALAEDNPGIVNPEDKGPKASKDPSRVAEPKAAHYGPGYGTKGAGMRNAPAGPPPGHKRYVTPYGDFCPLCTNYGIGRKAVGIDHALKAMKDYFERRGFEIRNVIGKGRFLKAEVFKDNELVDKVLFDRRTGRIRSIY